MRTEFEKLMLDNNFDSVYNYENYCRYDIDDYRVYYNNVNRIIDVYRTLNNNISIYISVYTLENYMMLTKDSSISKYFRNSKLNSLI